MITWRQTDSIVNVEVEPAIQYHAQQDLRVEMPFYHEMSTPLIKPVFDYRLDTYDATVIVKFEKTMCKLNSSHYFSQLYHQLYKAKGYLLD